MKKRETYIQLAGDRLVLAMPGPDGALRHASAPITLSQEPGQWIKEVSRLSSTLREFVERLGVEGSAAHVLYTGPTQAVAIESLPVRSTAQATEAAKLSCLDTVNYASASATCEALLIGRDGFGETKRMHVVVAMERDDVLGELAQCVEDAGLKFASALPIDAPIMAQLAERGLADDEPAARLYLGESSSLFVISGRRSLLFARRLGLGFDSLVNALTRPIRARSGEEPVTLSEKQAREILLEHGMPDRDAVIHREPELCGMHIIPVLQPVLQRIVVELKQSLRFSLSEESAETVPIRCLGPGSRIPGLTQVIALELGVSLADDESNDAATGASDPRSPALTVDSIGLLTDAVRDRRILRDFALLPAAHACEQHRTKLQRWIWAGAAAALVMVAIDGFRHHAAVESLSAQKATMLSHHSELDAFQRTSTALAGALGEMSRIERSVDAELRDHFDGYAALAELAELTPETIHLSEITFRQMDTGVVGTITGLARHGANEQTALKAYVEEIRRSPLFADAALGNVQVSREAGRMGERFEALLTLTPLPRPEKAEVAERLTAHSTSSDGGEP